MLYTGNSLSLYNADRYNLKNMHTEFYKFLPHLKIQILWSYRKLGLTLIVVKTPVLRHFCERKKT